MNAKDEVDKKAKAAREAALKLATVSAETKDKALTAIAEALIENRDKIIRANEKDLEKARKEGVSEAFIERLTLNDKRINGMVSEIGAVKKLKDPVGEIVEERTLKNGLQLQKVRVPLGVIGIIYESRPNVTSDASVLCLKAGNAIILRGGSNALNSNVAIAKVISEAAEKAGIPKNSIQIIETADREAVGALLCSRGFIDVIIPRGGAGLINYVVENAKVPVIETGVGNCHTYVDSEANIDMAVNVAYNAKVQRCSVCNAMETLLVHRDVAREFLKKIGAKFREKGVQVHGCEETRKILKDAREATEKDWSTEYLDLIVAVKVVNSLDDAIAHINKYSSKHSEAIITENKEKAEKFLREIDSAAVFVNASTRFTDGNQFEMGSEIGISTQKLHARGPMSAKELTSTKFVIRGSGQIRE